MFQMVQKKLKSQRGMTLIELLAVIVILGIIAAIAIPSILGLIDNSKKDAHVANAQQMINSTKIAITSDKSLIPDSGKSTVVPLSYLEGQGYLETLKDPDGNTASYLRKVAAASATTSTITNDENFSTAPTDDSYVLITNSSNSISYAVRLVSTKSNRGVQSTATSGAPIAESSLTRSSIH